MATQAKPLSCVPQGRKVPNKTNGADVRQRPAQARHKPPLRGAKRQRRHSAAFPGLRPTEKGVFL